MSDGRDGSITVGRHPADSARTRVVLVGSEDSGPELVTALQRLGAEVVVVDDQPDGLPHRVADDSVVADVADADELSGALGRLQPEFVVIGTDAAAIEALTAAAATGRAGVVPGIRSTRMIADPEELRRLAADELGLPTVPFWFVGSADELRSVSRQAGFPMVVKPVAAPPGEGRSVMLRPDDIEPAWQYAVAAADTVSPRVLAETAVEVDCEVTLLTLCSDGPTGPVLDFCAPIGHRSIEGRNGQVLLESWQPQAMTSAAADAAKSIAARVVRALDGRGLFGVELLIRGNEVYFSGLTARPYDTGLLTMRTQRLSEFDLQARAVLGLPLDTIMVSPGAARLAYSARRKTDDTVPRPRPNATAALARALKIAESDVGVFADPGSRPRRRLAVAIATASDVRVARDRAAQAAAELDKLLSSDEAVTA